MRRLIIVYNPRSSQYANVKDEVLTPARKLSGFMVGKYEVAPTNLDDNIAKLSKIIKDGDLILAAGGDATGIIASNAVLRSGRDATLAALPYGNFNDLARTLGCNHLSDVIEQADSQPANFYPLEIIVDGKRVRWATCYVTIGMTAAAVKLYDHPQMRQKLRSKFGRMVSSYTELISWYYRNRHSTQFIPDFRLNGRSEPSDTSDYAAINGRYMARVMRGGTDFLDAKIFRSITGRLTHFWRLFDLMAKSILSRTPGVPTTEDVLQFIAPAPKVEIQSEGESMAFTGIKEIKIRKGKQCFKAIQNLHK